MKLKHWTLGVTVVSAAVSLYAVTMLMQHSRERAQERERVEKLENALRAAIDSLVAVEGAVHGSQALEQPSGPKAAAPERRIFVEPELPADNSVPDVVDLLADTIAQRVKAQVEEGIHRVERERLRERNQWGRWRASIDEVSAELGLNEEQVEAASEVWNGLKDASFGLWRLEDDDGKSALDYVVEEINSGTPIPEAWRKGEQRMPAMRAKKMPGSDKTYAEYHQEVGARGREALAEHLTDEQMRYLKRLKIAHWELKTGYDPWWDYVRERTGQTR